MRTRYLIPVLVTLLLGVAAGAGAKLARAQAEPEAAGVRFATLDVYIDSTEPLAAWQFELDDRTGSMTVVGIENGESRAFAGTPRYDRDAVEADRAERIIVADYSLAAPGLLPRGATRVATVHLRLSAGAAPELRLQLIAAGNAQGQPIPASISFDLQEGGAP